MEKNKLDKLFENDNSINYVFAALMVFYPVLYAVNEIVNKYIQYGAKWDSILCAGTLMVFVCLAIIPVFRRQNAIAFILVAFWVTIFVFTSYTGLMGAASANSARQVFFLQTMPMFFLGFAVSDFEGLEKVLYKITKLAIIMTALWEWVVLSITDKTVIGFMSMAYYFLPFCFLAIYFCIRSKFKDYKVWMIAAIIITLVSGTRGPILFTFVFLGICILHFSHSRGSIVAVFFVVISAVLIWVYFTEIMLWLEEVFARFGITNAAIHKTMYNDDVSDGRYDLYNEILPYIKEHWLLGSGIYADRPIIGGYTHLFTLEVCLNFGIPAGIFITLWLAVKSISTIVKNRKNDFLWALLVIMLFCGYFKLFISGSYLEEPYFFCLLGMLFSKYVNKKGVKDENTLAV